MAQVKTIREYLHGDTGDTPPCVESVKMFLEESPEQMQGLLSLMDGIESGQAQRAALVKCVACARPSALT